MSDPTLKLAEFETWSGHGPALDFRRLLARGH